MFEVQQRRQTGRGGKRGEPTLAERLWELNNKTECFSAERFLVDCGAMLLCTARNPAHFGFSVTEQGDRIALRIDRTQQTIATVDIYSDPRVGGRFIVPDALCLIDKGK